MSIFAGRLKIFVEQWKNITSDQYILSIVEGYKLPFDEIPIQKKEPPEPVLSREDILALPELLDELMVKGAISRCHPSKGQFLSSFFLLEKPNGEKRFILNLKRLNKFITAPHFKLEDLKNVLRLIRPGNFMATLDLKDSYFLIPIDKRYRKYLRFSFQGQLYEFNCMPFGLNTAPQVFTKLLKPLAHSLRSQGFLSVIYLDDILLLGKTPESCKKNVAKTRALLESLGLVLNLEKCQLEPEMEAKYLGFIIDSEKFEVRLPERKIEKILKLIGNMENRRSCKIRELANLIGTLVSVCPAVEYGPLYIKVLEREKVLALQKAGGGDYSRRTTVSSKIRPDLLWWKENITIAKRLIRDSSFKLEIFTDASLSGWGAYCDGESTGGWWSCEEKESHINVLEMKAASLGLKCFASRLEHGQVLLRIDNTTAIACINKMGSVQYKQLHNEAKELWQWCERRELKVFASYIASKENCEADAESRKKPTDTEWALAGWAFREIEKEFGKFDIDLFASYSNRKCEKFISWHRDPLSYAIDAFTIDWSDLDFYAFPPFSLISRVLKKILDEGSEGVLVVPYWPAQCWYPLFEQMRVGKLITFQPQKDLLVSSFSSHHPLHKSLTLAVSRLSGKNT